MALFAFVIFGRYGAQGYQFDKPPGDGSLGRKHQVTATVAAANPQNSPFDDDFVQIEQSHNGTKTVTVWANGQLKGTNAACVG
ncbi:MAG: hypothetical protein EOP49_43460 [Sphingobacteriales bacterium]|nr:MAG: hypothetical protein EOP49_43460 [Sphingobacteriales bacterium]